MINNRQQALTRRHETGLGQAIERLGGSHPDDELMKEARPLMMPLSLAFERLAMQTLQFQAVDQRKTLLAQAITPVPVLDGFRHAHGLEQLSRQVDGLAQGDLRLEVHAFRKELLDQFLAAQPFRMQRKQGEHGQDLAPWKLDDPPAHLEGWLPEEVQAKGRQRIGLPHAT
ncbi:hypothetical protein D3C86_1200610 [compost metagenome]